MSMSLSVGRFGEGTLHHIELRIERKIPAEPGKTIYQEIDLMTPDVESFRAFCETAWNTFFGPMSDIERQIIDQQSPDAHD